MQKSTIFKIVLAVGVLTVGYFAMETLGSTEKHSNKRDVKPEIRKVEVLPIQFQDIELKVDGNGVIESQKTLDIISEISGKVIFAKNNLKSGTYVKKGELILEVDSREAQNNLFSMRADFLNTLTKFLPEIKYEDEGIYKKWNAYFSKIKIDSETPELPKIEDSREKIKISSYNIFSKYFAVKNAELNLSKHKTFAPFNGSISSNGIIEGSFVGNGQKTLTLRDVENLEISVPLLLEDAKWIEFAENPEAKIIFDEKNGDFITGQIFRKDNLLERNSQTVNAYISFENNGLNSFLFPGNYVTVQIRGKKLKDVSLVPRYTVDSDDYIYLMVEGKLAREKVNVISFYKDFAILDNSLPRESKIIKTILQKPLIGMQIKDINEPDEEKTEVSMKDEE
ncbi:MAG: HlyD family efflux transporter periplasmic adaptor subunit [Calditrichaeota bacterium]|nr:MAG: HlyD family efflux transporter periplasmic adaptor subunit [Calditrichota bacterium]